MSTKRQEQAICVRTTRLNNLILGNADAKSKASKTIAGALCREALLDSLALLYNECDKDGIKKKDQNVNEFVNKYREVISETEKLRVNIVDFNLGSLIGKGYYGVVHLATEKATGDIYAIKTIPKRQMSDSQHVKEERDIMASRSSEWITALQYAFQDKKSLYLVMEYLPGGDLFSLMIRNGAFDEDLARFYLAEMTMALDALHTLGFVHRDIKPENILLDRFGHLKLADFGSSTVRNKDGNAITFSPVGTSEYVAPELLQALSTDKPTKSIHDVTCDFWSMGVIGYELLTETTPFRYDDVNETYARILAHGEKDKVQNLKYPQNFQVSIEFRDLIDHLVSNQKNRFTCNQIMLHPYFETVRWDSLRLQTPPIIPTLNGDDDTSNFEDIQKKSLRGTFTKPLSTFGHGSGFSGQNLPFIGYSFVHEEQEFGTALSDTNEGSNTIKLKGTIKDLQKMVDEKLTEVKLLQQQLLVQERKSAQINSMEKILSESKKELATMKEKLKEKTVEIATCKTKIKTLQSSLKIEEEMREKSDTNISELLTSTYQKWERSKKISDQQYEKQLSEKKMELSNLNQALKSKEEEYIATTGEFNRLKETIDNYKEQLKQSKEQNKKDKADFDVKQTEVIDQYENQIKELRQKLHGEKKDKRVLSEDMRQLRRDSEMNFHSVQGLSDVKAVAERSLKDAMDRLNKEIDANKDLREEKRNAERQLTDLQRRFDDLQASAGAITSRRSSNGQNDVFHSLRGSFESLSSALEEQLRNDLLLAKEGEVEQRKRADRLEGVVKRLEEAIERISVQSIKPAEQLLERQNEKLEDKLATIREQAIVERQSSRAANLALWKVEKQLDAVNAEKSDIEIKLKRVQTEKDEVDKTIKELRLKARIREEKVSELQTDISNLKTELQKEHVSWEKAEHERLNEKSQTVVHISKIQNLEEKLAECTRKLRLVEQRNDSFSLENKRLLKQLHEEQEELQKISELNDHQQTELSKTQQNYDKLKRACIMMDAQFKELETRYETESSKNDESNKKLDKIRQNMNDRDTDLMKMRREINEEKSMRSAAEYKLSELEKQIAVLTETLETTKLDLNRRCVELKEKTANLFEVQEIVEVNKTDIENLQRINDNFEKKTVILKEENTKILTDFFMSREENNKLAHECKNLKNQIYDQNKELEHLSGTLSEMKTYYLQRDLKSEATQSQYKKLIDYLQQRVDELSAKKKKSLSEMIFGSHNSTKKENVPPSTLRTEDNEEVKKLQADLKRERSRSSTLKEQLLKSKTNNCVQQQNATTESKSTGSADNRKTTEHVVKQTSHEKVEKNTEHKEENKMHRFEMTLQSSTSDACVVCRIPILGGNSHWNCKECKVCVHRKCRGNVISGCQSDDKETELDSNETDSLAGAISNLVRHEYVGDVVYRNDKTASALAIFCVVEILENVLLLGTSSGLISYNIQSQKLVQISGLDTVTTIAINPGFPKCILVGSLGNKMGLYQCDLRHLQARAQASACLNPTLQWIQLDVGPSVDWHYAKIWSNEEHNAKLPDAIAIVGNSRSIKVMCFDIKTNCFVVDTRRVFHTKDPITSVLFTKNTALVSCDKFFEIDLETPQAEEFIDLSDSSISIKRYSRPMAAFKINKQEYLLCFENFGLFTDEFGCRSRVDDIIWSNSPTGFIYRDPVLFICGTHSVQVMRISKSASSDDDIEKSHAFIMLNEPKFVGETEKMNVFVLTNTNGHRNDVVMIDAVKALKSILTDSMETLLSSQPGISYGMNHGMSIDTLSSLSN